MNIPKIRVNVSQSDDPQDARIEDVTAWFMLDYSESFRDEVKVRFVEDLLSGGVSLGDSTLTLQDLINQAADDVLAKFVAAHPDRYKQDAIELWNASEEEFARDMVCPVDNGFQLITTKSC